MACMTDACCPCTPRALDHLVLPTGSLATARRRLCALGFTVAPTGMHPFGTENACVYLADGTFLEPLAVGHRETCEVAARAGNVFVARDQAYRFRRGEEGFSALVMATQDARNDHDAFVRAGISAGEMLAFSRPFEAPDGAADEASFLLAFAADLRAPDAFFFTCERVNVPAVDRSRLEVHANGATGIREVALSEVNPTDFQYLLQDVVGEREVKADSFGMTICASNAAVAVLTPAGLDIFFGARAACHARGLRLRAIVFTVKDLGALERHLARAHVAHDYRGNRIVVPQAPGQGAIFAFEEDQ